MTIEGWCPDLDHTTYLQHLKDQNEKYQLLLQKINPLLGPFQHIHLSKNLIQEFDTLVFEKDNPRNLSNFQH